MTDRSPRASNSVPGELNGAGLIAFVGLLGGVVVAAFVGRKKESS